jgi:hypothetical protein
MVVTKEHPALRQAVQLRGEVSCYEIRAKAVDDD